MSAKELVQAGQLNEALTALQDEVRAAPADAQKRVFLFQLLSVLGQWERAMTQLNVAAEMDRQYQMMAQVCRPLLNGEVFRQQVFAGKRDPLIFGEPEEWIGLMVQANRLTVQEAHVAAEALRNQAFETAPTIAGVVNDEAFSWIADADSRLGPILEIIIEGNYYWTSFANIKLLQIDPPEDLRDVIWLPVSIIWENRGQTVGFIPSRYVLSETCDDSNVVLARKTEWVQKSEETYTGFGQRMLTTDITDYPLMEIRKIIFRHSEE